ncbi:MAG: hypothetical protein QF830_02900, partial [Rhodospirillales bacterium]|nr:hypothetical protein [Rhodospirillales bacterium]
ARLSLVFFCMVLRKKSARPCKRLQPRRMAGPGTEPQIGPPSRLKGRFGRIDTGKKYTEPKARDFLTTD